MIDKKIKFMIIIKNKLFKIMKRGENLIIFNRLLKIIFKNLIIYEII